MSRWEQEKAYTERRAGELVSAMEQAIETGDNEEFKKLFEKAERYVKKRDRDRIMREWIKTESARRRR